MHTIGSILSSLIIIKHMLVLYLIMPPRDTFLIYIGRRTPFIANLIKTFFEQYNFELTRPYRLEYVARFPGYRFYICYCEHCDKYFFLEVTCMSALYYFTKKRGENYFFHCKDYTVTYL